MDKPVISQPDMGWTMIPDKCGRHMLRAALALGVLLMACARAAAVDDRAVADGFLSAFHNPAARAAARSAGAPLIRDPTMAVLAVVRNWDKLQPETREELARHIEVMPPGRTGAREVRAYDNGICPDSVSESADWHKDSAHFRVVYKNSGTHGTESSYADEVLAAAENVFTAIAALGFPHPVMPSDGRMRIYLCELVNTFGVYGITWPEELLSNDTARAHLELDNDFDGIPLEHGETLDDIVHITLAHEFFHATQFAMAYTPPSSWILESTATWMEDQIYDSVNDYYSLYVPSRFSSIDEPLDYWSQGDVIGYGSAIFFQYVTESVATEQFIYTLFNTIRTTCVNPQAAAWCSDDVTELALIDSLLGNFGTNLKDTYAAFNVANYLKDYVDGDLWFFPDMPAQTLSVSSNSTLDHLSSRFYKVDLCAGSVLPQQLDMALSATGADWRLILFRKAADGSHTTQEVALSNGTGADTDLAYCDLTKSTVALVSNVNMDTDARAFTVTPVLRDIDYETFEHTFGAGWRLVGTPFDPAYNEPVKALNLTGRLLARVKQGKYLTNDDLEATAPGQAFWVYFESAGSDITAYGLESGADTVPLTAGWNMLGVPFNSSVPWDGAIQVVTAGGTFSLGSAQADAFVQSTMYTYNADTGAYDAPVALAGGFTLAPWDGFVVKALQACSLKFPKP